MLKNDKEKTVQQAYNDLLVIAQAMHCGILPRFNLENIESTIQLLENMFPFIELIDWKGYKEEVQNHAAKIRDNESYCYITMRQVKLPI